jgi:DNA-binding CsgD family transcriptional regulator
MAVPPMPARDALARGRAAYARQAWAEAYACLSAASHEASLDCEDLVRLAHAAGLTGHSQDSIDLMARAHRDFLRRDDVPSAARCAFWLCMRLQSYGEHVRGGGWLARARQILEESRCECVEQGYVLIPLARQLMGAGDFGSARAMFEQAHQIGQRFGEPDLIALARLGLGIFRAHAGSPLDGLAYLDDVMVAVETEELSPLVTGILYCAVIDTCHEVYDLRRAQEWTDALARWCAAHPDIVPFRGQCQVHRAQILQLHGAWPAALEAAQSIAVEGEAAEDSSPASTLGAAYYQKAELHRLRGEFDRAEDAYRAASRWGFVPEPGLAQLRLAQGYIAPAAATIGRALDQTSDRSVRARLLPAAVEIMLASGDLAFARAAAEDIVTLANQLQAPFLRACGDTCMGAVMLAEGDARSAFRALSDAFGAWQQIDAPYEVARTRELIGLACRKLGDEERARLELDSAEWAFRQLGAGPDCVRVSAYSQQAAASGGSTGVLTPRETEVLRLLAAGKSNRAIAVELVLSEKTVARHVSNIFDKLGLSSRSAAVAYAYKHALV